MPLCMVRFSMHTPLNSSACCCMLELRAVKSGRGHSRGRELHAGLLANS